MMRTMRNWLEENLDSIERGDAVAIIWTVNDIIDYASEILDTELTLDEAREILSDMHRKHDASIGINWDVVETFVAQR